MDNACIACLDGFVGEECDTPCVYPSYGRNCGFICNCMGCLQVTTVTKDHLLPELRTITTLSVSVRDIEDSDKQHVWF